MPKIEVNEKLFYTLLGTKYDYNTLEERLTCGKAELDEKPDESLPEDERSIKIELNDTNRPDLWSTSGVVRQLKQHKGGKDSRKMGHLYDRFQKFLSNKDQSKDFGNRVITVDEGLKNIRPYMVAFVISGKAIDDNMLKDIIQTQEKLCWNFGRKRRSVAMGVYRQNDINWPCTNEAVDPDETSFIPLGMDKELTCREILTEHPKGQDFGWILKDFPKFPLFKDAKGEILSMAPVINSAKLGAVAPGDKDLLVEMTGTDMPSLLLACMIVACDFSDAGYEILPVKVIHAYDTGFGKEIVTPFYFQETTSANLLEIQKLLGVDLSKEDVLEALERMGVESSFEGDVVTVTPPPYRNDFLHAVDITEDVMMGKEIAFFTPEAPSDFTIGRLAPITTFSRKAKELMVGMGYQEMIFNYLGSKKDYIDNMNIDGHGVIEIANPMSENYQFVRASIIPSLMKAESCSANAVYPHKIFEIGKVAFLAEGENTGTKTRQDLGFVTASADANYNTAAAEVATLLNFLDHSYEVAESEDPRFIPGRQAQIIVDGKKVGIFGEIHPQVLENWAITVPCVAGELDLEDLL